MPNYKHIFAAALMTVMTTGSFAQELTRENFYPNGFIGVQGGGHMLMSDYNTENNVIKPFVGLQLGSWFMPELGVRLSLQGYENKWKFKNNIPDYSNKSFTGDIDLMLSLSNLFFPFRSSQRWNTMLVAGLGVGTNTVWDNEYKGDRLAPDYQGLSNDVNKYWLNSRVGLGVEYNISKLLGINFEVDYNLKNSNLPFLTSKKSLKDITAAIGLNVRFGCGSNSEKEAVEAPVTSQADYEAEIAARAAAEARAAEAAKAKALEAQRKAQAEADATAARAKIEEKYAGPLKDVNLEYDLCGTDPKNPDVISEVVEWTKRHADARIVVNGYADRGTGNPSINMKYSKLRATKVADSLKAAGVPADQIIVKAWGDKVQPYKENDKNRCVIVVEK